MGSEADSQCRGCEFETWERFFSRQNVLVFSFRSAVHAPEDASPRAAIVANSAGKSLLGDGTALTRGDAILGIDEICAGDGGIRLTAVQSFL